MMLNRRTFGGLTVAGMAAAALKPLAAFAAEKPCRLKLGILSDIHVSTMEQGSHFRKALKWFDSQKVDGVVISGDLGYGGLIREMKCVADIWYEVFPGDKRTDGGHVEKLFVTGNHDVDGYFYHRPEFPKVKFPVDEQSAKESFVCNRERVWEELFHEKYEPVKLKEINGFKFVLFQWFAHLASDICAERWLQEPPDTPFYNAMRYEHKKLDEFFAAHGEELKGERPFFYIQHHHPTDTLYSPFLYASPQGWGGHDCGRSTKYLKNYPNCIALSGHTHVTPNDERTIWQGAFTSIEASACPGIDAAGIIGGRSNAYAKQIFPEETHFDNRTPKVGELLSVYDDCIVIKKREFSFGDDLGEDWVLPWPLSRGKPYAYETQAARAVAPQFPEGTRLKVTEKEDRIILEFPTVRRENTGVRALDYEVIVEARVEDYRRQVECRRVYSTGFALAERHDRGPVRVVFDKKKFEENRYNDIVYTVRPCDAWGNKGKPICAG
jgi:predicted phosphodiesterase